jgi:hypothetical protein
MAESTPGNTSVEPDAEPDAAPPQEQLEAATYEIIRKRLRGHGQELRSRLDRLNDSRRSIFGAIETRLLGTNRITTANNCTPRDIVAIGERFIFGYNVHIGLRSETTLADVFSVYSLREGAFHEEPLDLLADEQFQRDLKEVFRYYKDAVFAKFFTHGVYLYLVFRVGKSDNDIKSFKWLVQDNSLKYLDNRSDHEVQYPAQHEFQWTRTTRDQHHYGLHPHVSIEDRVFVETVGGDLTVKVENNTDSGEGVYSEPVDNPDQTLDDAEIQYAVLGNQILMRIRPYQERASRYLVFNEKLQQVVRIDSLAEACVLLPEDQGFVFPNGYYLQTGEYKTFDSSLTGLLFEKRVPSPNGEDVLYVFYQRAKGVYVLLHYNVIAQRMETPLICNGAALFGSGELLCFKAETEPQKHHALQIWQTPYTREVAAEVADPEALLYKVGNRDLVRAMAECREVLNLVEKDDTYANLYIDLVRKTTGILDSYFWLDQAEAFLLHEPLGQIREAASTAIEEFEKVVRVRKGTATQSQRVAAQATALFKEIKHQRFERIDEFVASLSELRRVRGEVISLRDLRYVDLERVDQLEQQVSEHSDRLAKRCVEFLLRGDSLAPYQSRVATQRKQVETLTKVADARALEEEIAASGRELELLIDIVSNLKIDDATQRTTIIDNISTIFATVNQARSALKARARDLMSTEGAAEFASQIKLLGQSVVNYLDVCDTPQRCDELLTKLMVQIEELEGRFAEFDQFVEQLVEKREEIYNAFEQRKLSLIEARSRRAAALANAADRILKGIATRVDGFQSVNEINGYFASDLMIDKVRDLVKQLADLEDTVKVDEIQSRLKTIREDAVRQLKDRQDLFVDGNHVIKLGTHRFSVNVHPLDLTTVTRDRTICLHLTGTNFFEPLEDPELAAAEDLWEQEVVSESRTVARAQYLAYVLFQSIIEGRDEADLPTWVHLTEEEMVARVQQFMGPRYSEGYVKGVHDHDASRILHGLLEMHHTLGLLRYGAAARTMAKVLWQEFWETTAKQQMTARLKGFGRVEHVFPTLAHRRPYVLELQKSLESLAQQSGLFPVDLAGEAAEYLFHELTTREKFAVSRRAADLFDAFQNQIQSAQKAKPFHDSLTNLSGDPRARHLLARDWASAYVRAPGRPAHVSADDEDFVDELASLLATGLPDRSVIVDGSSTRDVDGLVSEHPSIVKGRLQVNYHRLTRRLADYCRDTVPRHTRYLARKRELVEAAREELRLEEFRPRVLTSFVRNRLIDEVYLPLIGNNLAKQVGVVGEDKRTDLMGLLLLVSPPGYGKTTLMEYVANRLGVIFMKINGPAIGHRVTSLDPAEAPNAAAREEVEKLNLAFEMGDNVMIYLDDIQHCHPELLQKFISLCDAQRKIEGVYGGRTRTYDLRGKKVVVVMAGNPYTESGEKFKIPDMLANRADVYNLGEIIGDTAEAFEMSYLENALTSNPVLNKLATRSQADVYGVIRIAQSGSREGVELEGNYAPEELAEMVSVMKKLGRVRDIVLAVNREYIRSAAMAHEYRTEPPFKLQGSYRNMNRIAEKVSPIMNERELETLILSNYENDAQTLTSDNEANMLKFKQLLGVLSDEETKRWAHIQAAYTRNARLRGVSSDDRFGQAVLQLSAFSEGLDGIRQTMAEGIAGLHEAGAQLAALQSRDTQSLSAERLTQLLAALKPALPPQEVIVQHKIPRVVLGVVTTQFELMNRWLSPLLEVETKQSSEMQQLRAAVEKCLASYTQLIDELKSSDSEGDKSAG